MKMNYSCAISFVCICDLQIPSVPFLCLSELTSRCYRGVVGYRCFSVHMRKKWLKWEIINRTQAQETFPFKA